ncbi:MAG: hypothetical protein AAAFM81_06980 [Pseudomonadota bacterium]
MRTTDKYLGWLLALCASVGGVKAAEVPDFARIQNDSAGLPATLQMAIARYEIEFDGVTRTVDLIGAVHIGEPEYYDELNDAFATYDAVLYELVAPEGARVQPNQKPDSWLSKTQYAMTQGLDLQFQLDGIDYQVDNLVHADLSPSEVGAAMRERGESPIVLAWRLFSYSLREGAVSSMPHRQAEMFGDLLGARGDNGIKVMLARELTRTDTLSQVLGDDADNSIIGARNARAIEVLLDQLDTTDHQSFAIFYGVAHLPDFHRRLTDELDFTLVSQRWVDAWYLN